MDKFIVTIARGFGSGGRTIGKMLADKLGVKFYDKDLIRMASDASGINEALFGQSDERTKSGVFGKPGVYKGEVIAPGKSGFISEENLFNYQAMVIKQIAAEGPCVIVGRCADYILRDRKDCLHVFICSDMASRARRIVERYGQTQKAPEKRLAEKDQKRKVYYKNYTGRVWGQAQNYDICLNSGALGVDTCADMIVQLCK